MTQSLVIEGTLRSRHPELQSGVEDHIAPNVDYLIVSQLLTSCQYVKVVKNTMSQDQTNPETSQEEVLDIPSVKPVTYLPGPAAELSEDQSASLKCTTCETVTLQFFGTLSVMPAQPIEGMEVSKMLAMTRKLVFCTGCGTYRVTK